MAQNGGRSGVQGKACSGVRNKKTCLRSIAALICGLSLSTSVFACDTAEWDAVTDAGGNLNPTVNASLESACGLEVMLDNAYPAYVEDKTPGTLTAPTVTQYLARFYFAHNDLVLGAGEELVLFGGYSLADNSLFQVVLLEDNGASKIKLVAFGNAGVQVSSMDHEVVLPDGWRALEVEWKAATGVGSRDGFMNLKVDGVAAVGLQNLTGLNNDTHVLHSVRLGVLNGGVLPASSGNVKFDAFVSYRDGDGGILDKNCSGNAVQLEHITFLPGSKTCVATSSLNTGALLTVDGGADVTMISPAVNLQPGFSIPSGATFRTISPVTP